MVAYISAFAVPAPLDQAVRRITTPPRMRRMRAYRVHMYLHVPARLWQEPSKRKKINPRAPIPSRGDMFRAGTCATTSHPPVPACDIRLLPYWHAGSCQADLAIYERQFTIVNPVFISCLVDFRQSHVAYTGLQAGFFPTQMTYNINRSTSRTVETSCQNGPPPADDFLGRARSVG